MSKSKGNYVGITEPANVMFGKLMSISDEMMWRYYDLLSFKSIQDVQRLKEEVANGRNPRDVKVELGKEIVTRFHSSAAADAALEDFVAVRAAAFRMTYRPFPSLARRWESGNC